MTDENRSENLKAEIERAAEAFRAAEALAGLGLNADCVSRAYYAALHIARALLLSRGLEPKSHSGVVRMLNLEFIRTGLLPSSFNRVFAGLQRSREYADYDAAVRFSTEDARGELEAAREFERAGLQLLQREGWLDVSPG